MTSISDRVNQIKPSATMAVNAKALELRRAGKDIINLSVGEPDFDTPDFIKQAAINAIQQGFTKYTPADGTLELKQAIIHKLKSDNQLHYEEDEIIVCSGVKHCLYNLNQAILNNGDEVIIPAPYWVSYPDMALLAGGIPVIIPTGVEQRFKITADQLAAAITPKTRALMLNSPNNPSGMAYTASELHALANVLLEHPNIVIASDDIYEYILWGMDHFVNILNVCPELKNRTLIMNGVSKAHAMTGWRIGYAAGPKHIIAAMKTVQSQSTSGPSSISQKAAVTALTANRDTYFPPMLTAYKRRHDFVQRALNELPGTQCLAADGTFYLLPNFSSLITDLGLKNDIELAEFFLEKAGIALVPGTPFGIPNHIRFSCATSDENLTKAMQRCKEAL